MNKNFKRKPEIDPDDIQRTDWMDPNVDPTIPGMYACKTGGGHIFGRKWDGATWRSSINGEPTTVRMAWRGLVPHSIDLMEYDAATRMIIMSHGLPLTEMPAIITEARVDAFAPAA